MHTHQYARQTDRQTDRQTRGCTLALTYLVSRGWTEGWWAQQSCRGDPTHCRHAQADCLAPWPRSQPVLCHITIMSHNNHVTQQSCHITIVSHNESRPHEYAHACNAHRSYIAHTQPSTCCAVIVTLYNKHALHSEYLCTWCVHQPVQSSPLLLLSAEGRTARHSRVDCRS
jgi:hypothetical protein